ncbi:MAG: hypothetical protein BMS9Abin01_0308 [Gammaproteobacteria bacterium]|nr:MAG: hypothetical protein BMS9Abin01_0308 [Gammaproteobacteria bacterium]
MFRRWSSRESSSNPSLIEFGAKSTRTHPSSETDTPYRRVIPAGDSGAGAGEDDRSLVARDLLVDGRRARIVALFKSSFYPEAGGAIACVANASLHACSLNVDTTAPGNLDWSANGLKTGAAWRVPGRTLYVGGRYVIAMDATETWTTTATPRHWNAMDLRRSVKELRRLCALGAPQEGLG